jgi:alpha-tubulin suppressor-like RCC1 family protein
VFATGKNGRGQLALGHRNDVNEPVLVTALDGFKIAQIASSGYYSVFITGKNTCINIDT